MLLSKNKINCIVLKDTRNFVHFFHTVFERKVHCEESDSPTKRRSGQVDRLNFPKEQARTFPNLVVPLPFPRIIRLGHADRSSSPTVLYLMCIHGRGKSSATTNMIAFQL